MLFAPELLLLLGCLLLFYFSLGDSDGKASADVTILLGLAASALCGITLLMKGNLFMDAYKVDLFSQIFKFFIAIGMTCVVAFGRDMKGLNKKTRPEYYIFLTLSCLGLMMLVSSVEMITLFVALELSSYSLYLMVPMRDDTTGVRVQMEAAIKYILFGVIATGAMLYGMSYMFGLTGSTHLAVVVPKMTALAGNPTAILAIALFMCGFFYKLAVFPFHFWVPDVYQGAANSTTAFIASVPKLGAVAIMIRLVTMAGPTGGESLTNLLIVLALCSMFYGNLSALVQTDIKRMLGFSGISHAGFVLLGLLTMRDVGFATSIYYIAGYVVMNLACFLVICKVSVNGENVSIEDLSGLHKRAPLLALTLGIGMFALAGIPPFVGFMGKFMLLTGALKAGHLTLVILAALNTAIAIYYYLSVVRIAFCSDNDGLPDVSVDSLTKVVSVFLMIVIIAMGVAPAKLVELATIAVRSIL